MMYLNIITACSRPHNLERILSSLQGIPKSQRRWIVVFDSPDMPKEVCREAECYAYWKKGSVVGHAQRNYAFDKIEKGHIYMLDDDTFLHPSLWDSVKNLDRYDFISFRQIEKEGALRLDGKSIKVNYIDTGSFIFSYSLLGKTRLIENKHSADGYFATELRGKSKSPIYIPKNLSIYNALR